MPIRCMKSTSNVDKDGTDVGLRFYRIKKTHGGPIPIDSDHHSQLGLNK